LEQAIEPPPPRGGSNLTGGHVVSRENRKQELSQINQLIQYNPALPPSGNYFATIAQHSIKAHYVSVEPL
jgi:hypothetical protein